MKRYYTDRSRSLDALLVIFTSIKLHFLGVAFDDESYLEVAVMAENSKPTGESSSYEPPVETVSSITITMQHPPTDVIDCKAIRIGVPTCSALVSPVCLKNFVLSSFSPSRSCLPSLFQAVIARVIQADAMVEIRIAVIALQEFSFDLLFVCSIVGLALLFPSFSVIFQPFPAVFVGAFFAISHQSVFATGTAVKVFKRLLGFTPSTNLSVHRLSIAQGASA